MSKLHTLLRWWLIRRVSYFPPELALYQGLLSWPLEVADAVLRSLVQIVTYTLIEMLGTLWGGLQSGSFFVVRNSGVQQAKIGEHGEWVIRAVLREGAEQRDGTDTLYGETWQWVKRYSTCHNRDGTLGLKIFTKLSFAVLHNFYFS